MNASFLQLLKNILERHHNNIGVNLFDLFGANKGLIGYKRNIHFDVT